MILTEERDNSEIPIIINMIIIVTIIKPGRKAIKFLKIVLSKINFTASVMAKATNSEVVL